MDMDNDNLENKENAINQSEKNSNEHSNKRNIIWLIKSKN